MTQNPPPPPHGDVVGDLAATTGEQKSLLNRLAREKEEADHARRIAKAAGRPSLTENSVIAYLDWLMEQVTAGTISTPEATQHMRACELVISKTHSRAQGAPPIIREPGNGTGE